MNSSSFNGATINGAYGDTSIRSAVLAYASAFVTANMRVLRRDVMGASASAVAGPVVGRARMRSAESVQAIAQSSITGTVMRKFIETCQAAASIVAAAYKRARISDPLIVAGQVVESTRKRASGWLSATAQASISPTMKGRVRMDAPVVASAAIILNAYVKSRTFISETISAGAFAVITANGVLRSRSAVDMSAEAQINAQLRARVRSVLLIPSTASILAQSGTFRRIPYDTDAPAERTVLMPARPEVLYLV